MFLEIFEEAQYERPMKKRSTEENNQTLEPKRK